MSTNSSAPQSANKNTVFSILAVAAVLGLLAAAATPAPFWKAFAFAGVFLIVAVVGIGVVGGITGRKRYK